MSRAARTMRRGHPRESAQGSPHVGPGSAHTRHQADGLTGRSRMSRELRKALRTGLLVVAPTLVLCLVMLEVGLRALGQLPSNATEGMFEKNGSTYRLRANLTKRLRTPSYTCTVETNSFGLRDRKAGERTLGPAPYFAFVGDWTNYHTSGDSAAALDRADKAWLGRLISRRVPLSNKMACSS